MSTDERMKLADRDENDQETVDRLQANWDRHGEKIGRPLKMLINCLEPLDPIRPSGIDRDLIVYALSATLRASEEDAVAAELEIEERSHERTIDQRDAAEECINNIYESVTGRSPEWSTMFGYGDAYDEIVDTVASLCAGKAPDAALRAPEAADAGAVAADYCETCNEKIITGQNVFTTKTGLVHFPRCPTAAGIAAPPAVDRAVAAYNAVWETAGPVDAENAADVRRRSVEAALVAAAPPAASADAVRLLQELYEWYDRDGSVGGAANVFEDNRNAFLALSAPVADAGMRNALVIAEAALADIGDAERQPGDDLAWCEARAAEALPQIRAALSPDATRS